MLNLSAFKLQNPSLLKNLNQFQQVIQLFRNHSIPPLWIGSTDQLTGSNLLADDPPRVRRSGWDLSPLAMGGEGSRGNVDHTHIPEGRVRRVISDNGRNYFVWRSNSKPAEAIMSTTSFEVMRGILAGFFFFCLGCSREPLHRPCSEKGPGMKRCLFWEMRRGFLFVPPIIDSSWVINDF